MKKSILISLAASFLLVSYTPKKEQNGSVQLKLADELQLFLPEDLEATLWASSPMFNNPSNMDIDIKGRIWITEAVNYRNFNNDSTKFLHRNNGDRIMILEDTDGDGKCDHSKVFVEDKDLLSPLGIAVLGNKVYVSCSPHLIVYTDDNGDDIPDKKEILLTGFGGKDHDHGLHTGVAGPDGKFYFNMGNSVPNIVTDKSGWTLRTGVSEKNEGALVSDDNRVWVGGMAFRMSKEGKGLEVIGHNFRNSYENTVDSYGNFWQNDNDDEVQACRVGWLMEGGNVGYMNTNGLGSWKADRRPGQEIPQAHWHQEDPGALPAGDIYGSGSPTGIVVNEGDELGQKYRGMLLNAEAGRNAIFGYYPKAKGAGYDLKRFNFVSSVNESTAGYVWNEKVQDKRKWFRPSDVAIGTDGAIYIADWYDQIVGGHQIQDAEAFGRIYRIAPKNKKLTSPKIDINTTAGQIQALLSPAINVRNIGFEKLKAQGPKVIEDVKSIAASENPYYKARAIWLLSQMEDPGKMAVEKAMTDPDPEIRCAIYRALRQSGNFYETAQRWANDLSPAVRREVAISMRDLPYSVSKNILIRLAQQYDGQDRWYLEALGIGASGKESELYNDLVKGVKVTPENWSTKMTNLAWRLHPVQAILALKARANSERLSLIERKKALTALAFIFDIKAAQAMADLTKSSLKDVAKQADWWLTFRKANEWRPFKVEGWELKELKPKANPEMLALGKKVENNTLPETERIEAAKLMAVDRNGSLILVGFAAWNKLPAAVMSAVGSQLTTNSDPVIAAIAKNYFQTDDVSKYTLENISKQKGDAIQGKALFNANCSYCHRVNFQGGDIGPELTKIKDKFDKNGLLTAVLYPGKGVEFGYEPQIIITKNGGAVAGFIFVEGSVIVIRDAFGQKYTIPTEEIEYRVSYIKGSLMPDPAILKLKENQIADIAEYLMNIGAKATAQTNQAPATVKPKISPVESLALGAKLINEGDCIACHDVNEKKLGPPYKAVAAKYPGTPENITKLVNKVIAGGQGVWGEIPMSPHTDLKRENVTLMVKYILSLKK